MVCGNLIDQLIKFYRAEKWHKTQLSDEESRVYFGSLLLKGRILLVMEGEKVLGYCESWRINFEQLGRILCGESFCADGEDINSGNIAYCANVHILKEYRKGWVIKNLQEQFIKQNFSCKYFVGEARRKKSEPFKCFNRQEIINKYLKGEVA